MNLSKTIRKNLVNIPGWTTRRRIVVIESDDWGSIRMPSREVYEFLLASGLPVDRSYFLKYDCLESEQDLHALFEVLSSFKDFKGNSPVITANVLVANPDFEKIELSGRREYYFEPFTETYLKYPNHARSLHVWKNEGIVKRLLWPQFHGREHLNVRKWLRAINSGDPWENAGFSKGVLLGLGPDGVKESAFSYMAAFGYSDESEWKELNEIAHEGLAMFENIFEFKSRSFVAPCSIRGEHLDATLKDCGILFHQCGQQFIPGRSGSLKTVNRFWGQRNKFGQTYWRRNCTFEPSRNHSFDWVDSCMSEVKVAFTWHKPAVINSHRVNFIGSIDPDNRYNSLIALKKLLHSILSEWPDTEFFTSDDLGKVITDLRPSS